MMQSQLARLAPVVWLLSACVQNEPSHLVEHARAARSDWPDECSQLPGYLAFREQLERVVIARDTPAFVALLHPRLLPKQPAPAGIAGSYGWLFGRYKADAAWSELREVLSFGCARQGDKLLLPAMAKLIHDMTIEPEYDMAIVNTAVRAKPDVTAPVLRTLNQGDLVRTVTHASPPDWVVVWVDEQEAFVPAAHIRSPHDFQVELIRERGRWYIHEFGSGV